MAATPCAGGAMIVVRYADDTVVGWLSDRSDAERFLAELRIRMAKFALELHPGKTRLDRIRQTGRTSRPGRRGAQANRKPSTSARLHPYLFTIEAGRVPASPPYPTGPENSEASGDSKGDLPATLGTRTIAEQGDWLGGVRCEAFLRVPCGAHQRKCPLGVPPPCRRSLATRPAPAEPARSHDVETHGKAGRALAAQAPDISPVARSTLPLKHPRWEPYAGIPHVRFCAGGAQ